MGKLSAGKLSPVPDCSGSLHTPAAGISCQFLPPGGSMGARYVLELLFCKQ